MAMKGLFLLLTLVVFGATEDPYGNGNDGKCHIMQEPPKEHIPRLSICKLSSKQCCVSVHEVYVKELAETLFTEKCAD